MSHHDAFEAEETGVTSKQRAQQKVERYLQRIGFQGDAAATPEALREIHRAHMFSVPFENLDINLGRPIVLSLPALFEKIVLRHRGGFCYELNGLFGWLLREIGFPVEMLSARVFSDSTPGPDFDHMLLLVDTGDGFIADVGFGDSFVDPLPLASGEQVQQGCGYRLVEREERWELHQQNPHSDWEPQYTFSLTPRRLDEFTAMCHYQQTSPDSTFTRKSVCSKATPEGRITLSNGRLIVTSVGRREERRVESVREYRNLLREHFGFDIEDEAEAGKLWRFSPGAR